MEFEQCSICLGGGGFNPLWCISTPKFSLTTTGLAQKYIKNTLPTPPPDFTTNRVLNFSSTIKFDTFLSLHMHVGKLYVIIRYGYDHQKSIVCRDIVGRTRTIYLLRLYTYIIIIRLYTEWRKPSWTPRYFKLHKRVPHFCATLYN